MNQYITKHIASLTMSSDERIEAQTYVRHLARLDGALAPAKRSLQLSLQSRDSMDYIVCSAMEAEGWKRSFDELLVGIIPMSSGGDVRRDWYDVEADGYCATAGAGNEYHFKGSEQPHYESVSMVAVAKEPMVAQIGGQDWTPKCVLDKRAARAEAAQAELDEQTNDWLLKAEQAETDIERTCAFAGGVSPISNWLL